MTAYRDKDIINILGNIPIFQGLDAADYAEILPLLRHETCPPGAFIIREGTHGDSMCVIIRGSVKVTKTGEDGEEILLEPLYAGSFFGEFSLVDNMPRSANVITMEETELFRLAKKDFDPLLAKNSAISGAFYKNCLEETFSRFRNIISNFAFTQNSLREKSSRLEELSRDLSLARKIQSYFINRDLLDLQDPFLPGVRHSYLYRPCIEIGGDFLNVAVLRHGLAAIIIADIMGHGITSALGTGVLKSAYSLSMEALGEKPTRLMRFLNGHFLGAIPQLYATCYYALVDMNKKRIKLAKAGHPHPLFWKRRKKDFIDINCPGTGLGLIKKPRFGYVEYGIDRGDRILFFTDGIIEQQNPRGEMYSEARLKNRFRELIEKNDENIVDRIYDDLKAFSSKNPIDDDITLLLLEF